MITELAVPVVNQVLAVILYEHASFDIGDRSLSFHLVGRDWPTRGLGK